MTLQFTKMHGLGNDFILIDAINQKLSLNKKDIIALARRDTGIGFDQCLLVELCEEPGIDFFYRIFNADGTEVGQCGNGARCLARFVHHYGLTDKKTITVKTKTTRMNLHLNPDNTVTVDFGLPNLLPAAIPLIAIQQAPLYYLPLERALQHPVHAINVGNPHAITIVDSVLATDVADLGPQISQHALFPEETNAGFMEIINPHQITLRVFERGCGETRACGSGAVAAAAIGRLFHGLAPTIEVTLPGGQLIVDWPNLKKGITLTGPACFIYEGTTCVEDYIIEF